MIGIIGAMEEEVAEILKLVEIYEKKDYQGYTFYEGVMNYHQVVVLQGGIGKVNAAISTTLLLTHYDIDVVINIGSAVDCISIKMSVMLLFSSGVIHHDVDVTAFGRSLGEVPGMPCIFLPDEKIY